MPSPVQRGLMQLSLIAMLLAIVWSRSDSDPAAEHRQPPEATRPAATPPPVPPTPDAPAVVAPLAPTRPAQKQAPTEDAAAADTLATLVDRASAGEPEAACRVALLGAQCRWRELPEGLQSALLTQASALQGAAQDAMVELLAKDAARRDTRQTLCTRLQALDPPDPAASLEAAARAGHRRARVLFALYRSDSGELARLRLRDGTHVNQMSRMTLVSPYYSANARRFLEEGLQAHDPLALEGMLLLYAPDDVVEAPALRLRDPDVQRFALLGRLLQHLRPDLPADSIFASLLQASLDSLAPEQRAAIERDAEAEAQRWQASGAISAWPDAGSLEAAPDQACAD